MKAIVLEAGKYCHIYNRGNNKENIFKEDKNYFYFLKLLLKHIIPVADVYAYCLLPNHFHLLVKIKDPEALNPDSFEEKQIEKLIWQPFSNLFNAYSKAINKQYERTGSLFQYKFKRKEITEEDYIRNLILYIHLNPVHHNINHNYKNYSFSSYKSILSPLPTNLLRDEVISYFGEKDNFIYCHERGYEIRIIEEFNPED